jgi:hypothetical protein
MDNPVTSVPEITRMLVRIHEWQEGHGKAGGRAEAGRRLDEAHKLLDEVAPILSSCHSTTNTSAGSVARDSPTEPETSLQAKSRRYKILCSSAVIPLNLLDFMASGIMWCIHRVTDG